MLDNDITYLQFVPYVHNFQAFLVPLLTYRPLLIQQVRLNLNIALIFHELQMNHQIIPIGYYKLSTCTC